MLHNCCCVSKFAPFAALSGYEEAVKETERLTDTRKEIDDQRAAILNERLFVLQERSMEKPFVTITYFVSDKKKSGGAYITVTGNVRWVDMYSGFVVFDNGERIPIMDIFDIQGDVF